MSKSTYIPGLNLPQYVSGAVPPRHVTNKMFYLLSHISGTNGIRVRQDQNGGLLIEGSGLSKYIDMYKISRGTTENTVNVRPGLWHRGGKTAATTHAFTNDFDVKTLSGVATDYTGTVSAYAVLLNSSGQDVNQAIDLDPSAAWWQGANGVEIIFVDDASPFIDMGNQWMLIGSIDFTGGAIGTIRQAWMGMIEDTDPLNHGSGEKAFSVNLEYSGTPTGTEVTVNIGGGTAIVVSDVVRTAATDPVSFSDTDFASYSNIIATILSNNAVGALPDLTEDPFFADTLYPRVVLDSSTYDYATWNTNRLGANGQKLIGEVTRTTIGTNAYVILSGQIEADFTFHRTYFRPDGYTTHFTDLDEYPRIRGIGFNRPGTGSPSTLGALEEFDAYDSIINNGLGGYDDDYILAYYNYQTEGTTDKQYMRIDSHNVSTGQRTDNSRSLQRVANYFQLYEFHSHSTVVVDFSYDGSNPVELAKKEYALLASDEGSPFKTLVYVKGKSMKVGAAGSADTAGYADEAGTITGDLPYKKAHHDALDFTTTTYAAQAKVDAENNTNHDWRYAVLGASYDGGSPAAYFNSLGYYTSTNSGSSSSIAKRIEFNNMKFYWGSAGSEELIMDMYECVLYTDAIKTDWRLAANWIPHTDSAYSLGKSGNAWTSLHLSESIVIDGITYVPTSITQINPGQLVLAEA